jgi:hypothetical protein
MVIPFGVIYATPLPERLGRLIATGIFTSVLPVVLMVIVFFPTLLLSRKEATRSELTGNKLQIFITYAAKAFLAFSSAGLIWYSFIPYVRDVWDIRRRGTWYTVTTTVTRTNTFMGNVFSLARTLWNVRLLGVSFLSTPLLLPSLKCWPNLCTDGFASLGLRSRYKIVRLTKVARQRVLIVGHRTEGIAERSR